MGVIVSFIGSVIVIRLNFSDSLMSRMSAGLTVKHTQCFSLLSGPQNKDTVEISVVRKNLQVSHETFLHLNSCAHW